MILYFWRGTDWVDSFIKSENWDARFKEINGMEIHEFEGLPDEQIVEKLKECFDITQVFDILENRMITKARWDESDLKMDRMIQFPFELDNGKSVDREEFLKEKREQLTKRVMEIWKGKNDES